MRDHTRHEPRTQRTDPALDGLAAKVADSSPFFGARRRKRAAERLAALGTPDALGVLAEELTRTTDEQVAGIAQRALGAVSEQAAVDAVAGAVVATGDERLAALLTATGRTPSDPGQRAVVLFLAGDFDGYAELDFDGALLRGVHTGASEVLRRRLAEKARTAGRLEWVRVVAQGPARSGGRLTDVEWDAAVRTLQDARRWPELWQLALDAVVTRAAPVLRALGTAGWQPDGHDRADFAELVRLARRAGAHDVPVSGAFGDEDGQVIDAELDVQCMAVTTDGALLLTGGSTGETKRWHIPSGRPAGLLAPGPNSADAAKHVITMTPTPDGTLLITGTLNGEIKLWRLPSGNPAGTYRHAEGKRNMVLGSNVLAAALNPAADLLATSGYGPKIQLWRLAAGRLTPTTTLHADPQWVPCLAITPDGTMLVSGGQRGNLRLWRLPDGAPIASLKGHTRHVGAVAVTPDGSLLASGSYDHTVRLWHLPSGEPAGELTGHTGIIRALAMSPDGKLLASAGKDRHVRLWHLPSGAPAGELPGQRGIVECLTMSPDGLLLASGSSDRRMVLWTRTRSPLHTLVRTPLGSADPAEVQRVAASSSSVFTPAERAWYDLLSALVRWRHRHDVELADAAASARAGARDVELDDAATPPGRPRRTRKGGRR